MQWDQVLREWPSEMYRIPVSCKRHFYDISRTVMRNDLNQQVANLLQTLRDKERTKQMQGIKVGKPPAGLLEGQGMGAEMLLMELLCLEGYLDQENIETAEVRKRLQSLVNKSTASLGDERTEKAHTLERDVARMEAEEGEILTLEQGLDTQARINSLRNLLLE